MNAIDMILHKIPIPRVVRVRQRFSRPVIDDPAGVLRSKLSEAGILRTLAKGARIAIAVGSRGITNQPALVGVLAEAIRKAGGEPFIVPAMGSHGGATDEGQEQMLRGMGIGDQAPIQSSMSVEEIGRTPEDLPVYVDSNAWRSDGIVVINRVKPHVGFRGAYESGLMKMLAIGLGKQRGAETCHNLGFGRMAANIPAIGKVVLDTGKVLFGVALLENAYHETCRIEVLDAAGITEQEPTLQEQAKGFLPSFPTDKLDVLVIDEIGKNISGTGFDNNVVGRFHTPFASGGPSITRVAALDLTEESHGNANGIGILDFTTRRLFEKMIFEQTYPNSLTSTVPVSVKLPMVLDSDLRAVQAAIKTCNIPRWEDVRLARVRNTLSMGEIELSENVAMELAGNENVSAVAGPYDLPFDKNGNLPVF
jgi:hypothetical protein